MTSSLTPRGTPVVTRIGPYVWTDQPDFTKSPLKRSPRHHEEPVGVDFPSSVWCSLYFRIVSYRDSKHTKDGVSGQEYVSPLSRFSVSPPTLMFRFRKSDLGGAFKPRGLLYETSTSSLTVSSTHPKLLTRVTPSETSDSSSYQADRTVDIRSSSDRGTRRGRGSPSTVLLTRCTAEQGVGPHARSDPSPMGYHQIYPTLGNPEELFLPSH